MICNSSGPSLDHPAKSTQNRLGESYSGLLEAAEITGNVGQSGSVLRWNRTGAPTLDQFASTIPEGENKRSEV